jgi:hypothetical protein
MTAPRLGGLDLLKGFLTCKIAAAHLFALAGFNVLYRPVSIGKPFTFGVLLFAFGLGLGLSTRQRRVKPLVTLLAAYLFGSLVIFVSLGQGRMELSGITASELQGLATLRAATQYVEYVLPFAFYYSLVLLFQCLGIRLRVLPWFSLLSLGLLIHWSGVYLNRLAPGVPGSALYAEGFRTLQYAPVFFAGMAASQFRQWFTSAKNLKPLAIWTSIAAVVAVNFLSVNILIGLNLTLYKFRALGSLKACLAIVLISVVELMLAEALAARYTESPLIRYFSRVGRRLPTSLMVQVLTVPLVALAAQTLGGFAGMALAIASIAAFLVLLDKWPAPFIREDRGDAST